MATVKNVEDLKDIVLTQDDFKFVNADKKIQDQKFQSKPTTYIKDAFRRFRKQSCLTLHDPMD